MPLTERDKARRLKQRTARAAQKLGLSIDEYNALCEREGTRSLQRLRFAMLGGKKAARERKTRMEGEKRAQKTGGHYTPMGRCDGCGGKVKQGPRCRKCSPKPEKLDPWDRLCIRTVAGLGRTEDEWTKRCHNAISSLRQRAIPRQRTAIKGGTPKQQKWKSKIRSSLKAMSIHVTDWDRRVDNARTGLGQRARRQRPICGNCLSNSSTDVLPVDATSSRANRN